ncbi:MAG: PAS domain S-box protein [Campylobacterales bacterium]|nr:PAS domain S-box protein [Campylobacterales bacterium]
MEETTPNELIVNLDDLIVSSTDSKGNITYANEIFCKIAGYTKEELIGQPHNVIRHEDMPKAIFKLLWDRVLQGQTIYVFVKNKAKNGDYYWVKAYVKPIVSDQNEVEQIISYRKPLNDFAKEYIIDLYSKLIEFEKNHSVQESLEYFQKYLDDRLLSYDEFIDRLSLGKSVINPVALNVDVGQLKNEHILFKQHILTEIKENKKNIEVVGSCCCGFGKWVESVQHESFTKIDSWQDVIRLHDNIHLKMQQYVDSIAKMESETNLNKIIKEVEQSVESMFENLQLTIDNSQE